MTKRKMYTPQQKVSILRKHLVEKAPVSQVCEEYNLRPTVFYRWQQEFFETEQPLLKSGARHARSVWRSRSKCSRAKCARRTRCWVSCSKSISL